MRGESGYNSPAMTNPNPKDPDGAARLRLRPAGPGDLELLRRWDEKPHVIAAGVDGEEWNWADELGRTPEWREQLIAELDGRPVGYLQIIDPALEEDHYWGRDCPPNLRAVDIWIGEERDLGRGHGSRMMWLALEKCFAAPHVEAVLADPLRSNARARRFYERMGFRFVEDRDFGGDQCAVYRLDRAAWRARPPAARLSRP